MNVDAAANLDPRLKGFLAMLPSVKVNDVTSREELLERIAADDARAGASNREAMEIFDSEDIAPSAGLRFAEEHITSSPDGNTIQLRVVRPDTDELLPCVYYIHGGGMATMSSTFGIYRTWSRLIARQGVVVVLVEFRNCEVAGEVPEVAPYPAGLNDCVSGLKWTAANAAKFGIDASRIVIAGESGGGNLTLATGMKLLRDGDIGLVTGLYAMCPYIAGEWPQDRLPSSIENNGILLDLHHNTGRYGYGIEAFEAGDPLAWPLFATEDDVRGLPRTTVVVNECDPLRDEGVEFYRLLGRAGVTARAEMLMGTSHAAELMTIVVPETSAARAASIATFARR